MKIKNIKNKIAAIIMFVFGILPIFVEPHDATLALFFVPAAICLFFSKKNWII